MDRPLPFGRVAVIGCGLIGGSVARATRSATSARVVVTDVASEVRARARELGVGHEVADSLEEAVAQADLIVVATPVEATVDVVTEVAAHAPGDAVVTDVASVKSRLVRDVEAAVARDRQFIGGHPMAGSEDSGLDAADPALFQGATWLLTPTDRSTPAAFERLSAHLRTLGSRVLAVDPARHDRLVAAVSHLPQVLASALMLHVADRSRDEAGLLAVAAGGFRDVTRVAASDPGLWAAILAENRPAVLAELDAYLERLRALRDDLDAQRWDAVTEVLEAARAARRSLPVKEVAGDLYDLVVPLPDEPGALATVTTALGEAGINIEDLSMRHADEGARGVLVIAIAGRGPVERAREVLTGRGYRSHVEPR